MKPLTCIFMAAALLAACRSPTKTHPESAPAIIGTWKLISNVIITKGDTAIQYPVKGKQQEMIKLYDSTHFAFFQHDLQQGKATPPVFDSGAGTYRISGQDYTEHLAYCNYREWENHDFKFKLTISHDTLRQRGIERIDSLKVNREIIETYVRVK